MAIAWHSTPVTTVAKIPTANTATHAPNAQPNTLYIGHAIQDHASKTKNSTTDQQATWSRNNSDIPLPTPIKPERLLHYLELINYDQNTTHFLIRGFQNGFRLGNSEETTDVHGKNASTVTENPEVIEQKLQPEIDKGRIAGPFPHPPFSPFHISPLNIRPKKTPGKFRLIHNLSYPYDGTSINSNIPQNFKTVQYSSIGDAIKILLTLPQGSFAAKSDIADAFRLIPVAPVDYPKLGMYYKGAYYYDRTLPQGCSSSCQIF